MEDKEFYQKLEEVLQMAPEARHSYFQLKHFVIGKEVTVQAQMWQCLRELQSRKQVIDSANLQIAENLDRVELMDLHHYKKNQKYQKKLAEKDKVEKLLFEKEWTIRCRQHNRRVTSLQNSIIQLQDTVKFAQQEARYFLQAFLALSEKEPLKDYDDLESQKQYWNEKISQKIMVKMLLQQTIDSELAETALSLHEDAPIRIQMENTLTHINSQYNSLKDKYVAQLRREENDRTQESN